MNNKVGRNNPYMCGSNKKYKKYGMSINLASLSELATTVDFSWLNLHTGGER